MLIKNMNINCLNTRTIRFLRQWGQYITLMVAKLSPYCPSYPINCFLIMKTAGVRWYRNTCNTIVAHYGMRCQKVKRGSHVTWTGWAVSDDKHKEMLLTWSLTPWLQPPTDENAKRQQHEDRKSEGDNPSHRSRDWKVAIHQCRLDGKVAWDT